MLHYRQVVPGVANLLRELLFVSGEAVEQRRNALQQAQSVALDAGASVLCVTAEVEAQHLDVVVFL